MPRYSFRFRLSREKYSTFLKANDLTYEKHMKSLNAGWKTTRETWSDKLTDREEKKKKAKKRKPSSVESDASLESEEEVPPKQV